MKYQYHVAFLLNLVNHNALFRKEMSLDKSLLNVNLISFDNVSEIWEKRNVQDSSR